ncbi:hypothetical protein MRB53_038003 [Persea americana]|nr:hypothetical protein MRB53_038003 [Persea americana]
MHWAGLAGVVEYRGGQFVAFPGVWWAKACLDWLRGRQPFQRFDSAVAENSHCGGVSSHARPLRASQAMRRCPRWRDCVCVGQLPDAHQTWSFQARSNSRSRHYRDKSVREIASHIGIATCDGHDLAFNPTPCSHLHHPVDTFLQMPTRQCLVSVYDMHRETIIRKDGRKVAAIRWRFEKVIIVLMFDIFRAISNVPDRLCMRISHRPGTVPLPAYCNVIPCKDESSSLTSWQSPSLHSPRRTA